MDSATLIGFVIGLGCILGAVYHTGDFVAYLDWQAFLIVIGGVVASTFVMFPMRTVASAFRVVVKAFRDDTWDIDPIIDQMIALSRQAKANGVLSLEDFERSVTNPFFKKALQLAVDGNPEDVIRFILATDVNFTQQRHQLGSRVFRQMALMAPSFGIIGTLIGLVSMLRTMDDPSRIGPSMAVALLATLYGALTAYLVCLPLANKLDTKSKEEALAKQIITEGIISIMGGANPKVLKEKLEAFLPPEMRKTKRMGA